MTQSNEEQEIDLLKREVEVLGEIVEELIDLEEHAKNGKKPPHARRYRIRIDRAYFEVAVTEMTGKEILALVDKTPDKYMLSQKFHHGPVEKIQPDQKVDFRHPGIERFQTLALDPSEG